MSNYNYFSRIIIFLFIVIFGINGCTKPTITVNTVKQMYTSAYDAEVTVSAENTWVDVGIFINLKTEKPDTSTITALFVAEASPGWEFPNKIGTYPIGKAIKIRLLLDGNVMSPEETVLATYPVRASYSFMTVTHRVPPGDHRIVAQWKSANGQTETKLVNQVLTVWQAVETQ